MRTSPVSSIYSPPAWEVTLFVRPLTQRHSFDLVSCWWGFDAATLGAWRVRSDGA